MKREPDLSLILACYNEEPIFRQSVADILSALTMTRLTFEIIFVDDKSSDATAKLIAQICQAHPFCKAIYHSKNTGRGKAVCDGILASRGNIAGYIDIDLEVAAYYIPRIVQILQNGEADVVVGRRIYRTSFVSLPREIFSVGYRALSNMILNTGNIDTESGYKFFNRAKILPILKKATHPHWFWDTEVIVYAKRAGLRIAEIPVLFLRRFDKRSSVRVVRDIGDYILSLWKLRKQLARGV